MVRLLALAVAVLALAGCSSDPGEEILGHWMAHTARELYVAPKTLTWVMHGRVKMSFPYVVKRVDPDTRRIDLKVDVPGGITYRIELAEDYKSGTLTEFLPENAVHRLERVDDRQAPD